MFVLFMRLLLDMSLINKVNFNRNKFIRLKKHADEMSPDKKNRNTMNNLSGSFPSKSLKNLIK